MKRLRAVGSQVAGRMRLIRWRTVPARLGSAVGRVRANWYVARARRAFSTNNLAFLYRRLIPRIGSSPRWAAKNLGRLATLIDELQVTQAKPASDLRAALAGSIAPQESRPPRHEGGQAAIRIAYLANSPVPTRAANCVHVMKMCNALAANGCPTTLIAQASRERAGLRGDLFDFFRVKPFGLALIPSSGNFTLDGVLICRAGLEQGATHFFGRSLAGCYAAALAGMPTALELHLPIRRFDEPLARDLFRQPSFRGLIVITHALKTFYQDRFPELTDRIHVVPDAADPPLRDGPPFQLAPLADFRVGYAGHLYAGKGAEIIVQLAERLPKIGFHVLGGYDKDVAHWEAKARGLGNIEFYGFRPQGEVSAFLQQLDVVVAPYLRQVDTFGGGNDIAAWMSPLKLFEYMAHGLPIVSSDLPALREVLENESNALLCDPDDIGAWVSAIEWLRLDDQLRLALARRAREDFALLYTWDKRAQKILGPLLASECSGGVDH